MIEFVVQTIKCVPTMKDVVANSEARILNIFANLMLSTRSTIHQMAKLCVYLVSNFSIM